MSDTNPGSAVAGNPAPVGGAGLAAAAALAPAAPQPQVTAPSANPEVLEKWFDSFPATLKHTIAAKGWDSLPQDKALPTVLESYVNLEKLFGMDKAGRTLTLPKEDATPEERADFLKKIGVPEQASDYGFDKIAPDLPDSVRETLAEAQNWMHKAGVPKDAAAGLLKEVAAAEAAKQEQWVQHSQQELNALTVELGPEFENKMEIARRAAKAAGLDPSTMTKVEQAMGTKAMLKMFMSFGDSMREASAPSPGNGGAAFTETVESARAQIQSLYTDKDFMAQYLSPNPKTREVAMGKMERLQKIVAGTG